MISACSLAIHMNSLFFKNQAAAVIRTPVQTILRRILERTELQIMYIIIFNSKMFAIAATLSATAVALDVGP